MKDGERGRPIENYGKKEQKEEWLVSILPDPHPCTAGNKEEEHIRIVMILVSGLISQRSDLLFSDYISST